MTIAAIETHYAGHRFRSRLEARWAVFFDVLGIEWMYEPQGYEIPNLENGSFPYLPDFWLPREHLWVEVKGVMTPEVYQSLLLAAAPTGLPDHLGAETFVPRTFDWYTPRLAILGAIPGKHDADESHAPRHCQLGTITDLVVRHDFVFRQYGLIEQAWAPLLIGTPTVENIYFAGADIPADVLDRSVNATAIPGIASPSELQDAYRAARMARFEHGESG